LHWPDGRISDLASLSRVRDAGLALASHDREWRLLRWQLDRPDAAINGRRRVLRGFMQALKRWATRNGDSTKIVTIPTGTAMGTELARVMKALDRAKSGAMTQTVNTEDETCALRISTQETRRVGSRPKRGGH